MKETECFKPRSKEYDIEWLNTLFYVSGLCKETMRRERWNVRQFIGRTGFVRVVDYGSGGWGHINFDDLRGNIRCQSKFPIKPLTM